MISPRKKSERRKNFQGRSIGALQPAVLLHGDDDDPHQRRRYCGSIAVQKFLVRTMSLSQRHPFRPPRATAAAGEEETPVSVREMSRDKVRSGGRMRRGRVAKSSKSSSFKLSWTLHFLAYFVCLTCSAEAKDEGCRFPSVPPAATYANVSGGAGQPEWTVRYSCDAGYELFGEAERSCEGGEWEFEEDEEEAGGVEGLPTHCAVNVALGRPASSSSESGAGGAASNAVDGRRATVHEGNKCTETESEKSPWWTVDLLAPYPVMHVRLTTRCCDDLPVKKAEVRVGNSSTPGENQVRESPTFLFFCLFDIPNGFHNDAGIFHFPFSAMQLDPKGSGGGIYGDP